MVFHVRPEERALIKRNNFSFRPLSGAGHQTFAKALRMALFPSFIFAFCIVILVMTPRYNNPEMMDWVHVIGLIALLAVPTISLLVFAIGVGATVCSSNVRSKAVVYWGWWPLWSFLLCIVAAGCGSRIGNEIWWSDFQPYTRIHRLQAYRDVDPNLVSGDRVQDAGMITFEKNAGVDRAKGGCLMNGVTYCVAPVLKGGEVTGEDAAVGTHDLFMAGVDCCTCSLTAMTDFRCGTWDKPGQIGGLRNTDSTRREMFRLAAEKWSSSYSKPSIHPVFFDWVQDPVTALHDMRMHGIRTIGMSIVVAVFGFMIFSSFLNLILKVLCEYEYAAPIDAPVPPNGLGNSLAGRFLPNMHKHYKEQQANAATRIGEGWDSTKYVIL